MEQYLINLRERQLYMKNIAPEMNGILHMLEEKEMDFRHNKKFLL